MRTIYLDEQFRCHPQPEVGLLPVQTDAFDGKCDTYLMGYRFLPEGSAWTREDGETFHGEMVAPRQPVEPLDTAQQQYEQLLQKLEQAYQKGVMEA